jgi:hypothetical protein
MSTHNVVRVIEQRKKQNQYYDMMNAALDDKKRVQQIALFEVSTTKKIEKRQKEVLVHASFDIFR